ncbi:MAG TPA: APC family permease [Allosphingosinicella sp.]|nr:APC family permease [Allosphingosinicella sp.]
MHPADQPPTTPRPLPRSLGIPGILFLTLSAITPAASMFITVPDLLQAAGTGALWAMLVAGIVCVATAYIYAELSSAWPIAGGEYVMVARTLGPLGGFVILGINAVNSLIFPAIVGLGLSNVLATILPGLAPVPVAVATVIACTLVSILHIRLNAWVTGIFLAVELAALIVLFALGAAEPVRGLAPLLLHPATASGPVPASAIGLAATVALFALNGYGGAVYFSEEMHAPEKGIARVVLLSLVVTLAVEIVPLAAVLVGAPDLGALFGARDPLDLFVAARGGPALSACVALGVAVAIVNAAIANILAISRFFYSTGRDGAWGGRVDHWMIAIHPRFHSPWLATLGVGAVGVAACFVPLKLLLVLSGAGLAIIYLGIALAAIVGRRSGATDHAPYRMPLFPLAPFVTIAAILYVFWTSWFDLETGRPGLIATGAQIFVSAAYYLLVLRRRGRWVVRDPFEEPAAA